MLCDGCGAHDTGGMQHTHAQEQQTELEHSEHEGLGAECGLGIGRVAGVEINGNADDRDAGAVSEHHRNSIRKTRMFDRWEFEVSDLPNRR